MACALLKTDATNVSDVAYQVGFTSAAYFSKCFKEHFQMKPTEYKTNQEQIPFDNRVVTSFKFA
jgi:AraC-like DNA-binding protein